MRQQPYLPALYTRTFFSLWADDPATTSMASSRKMILLALSNALVGFVDSADVRSALPGQPSKHWARHPIQ